ncbi:hypothetical protein C7418_4905 [Cupriavidus plantarum]|nr:hypothetical protein C7418_4905 [Cupriavidus plantarum]
MIPQAFPQFPARKRTRFCAADRMPERHPPSCRAESGYPRRIEYVFWPCVAPFWAKRTCFCAKSPAVRTYFCVLEVEASHARRTYPFLRRTSFCEIEAPGGAQAETYPFLRNISRCEISKAYLLLRRLSGRILRSHHDVYVYATFPAEPALTVYDRKPASFAPWRTRFCATFTCRQSVYARVYMGRYRAAYPILRVPTVWHGYLKRTRFCADVVWPRAGGCEGSFRTRICVDNVAHSLPTAAIASHNRKSVPNSACRAGHGRTRFC